MKSNYKPIGDLVERVDNRNKDGTISNLLGLSIDKKFIPSVANTIGTDLSTYKIIQKNDFAVSLMQVSRDSKIPIACQKEYEEAIMSPAYSIFRVKDTDEILPDYLELWFKRSEFDREAAFIAVGGVRGSMPWEEFARIKVYLPLIEKQAAIVKQYKTIADRIALKQRINDNLRETGTSVISMKIGTAALINKTPSEIRSMPLSSDWSIKTIAQFCSQTKSGSTPSREENNYWASGTIPWLKSGEIHNNITIHTEEQITPLAVKETSVKLLPKDTVLMAMYGVTAGEVGYLAIPATTNQAVCGMICRSKEDSAYLYFSLIQNQEEASRLSNGGAQENLSKNFIDGINIIVPDSETIKSLHLANIVKQITENTKEINALHVLESTLLAKLSR